MFHCLATSLNFAFKLFTVFDLDQTFSPNILRYKQIFDRLATFANKACASGIAINKKRNLGDVATSHVIIFSSDT